MAADYRDISRAGAVCKAGPGRFSRNMMDRLRPARLQVKLLLLAFVASLPAFGLLFWDGISDRERAIEGASDGIARVARLASLDQEKRLEGARHTVNLLSRVPTLRGGSAKACAELLADLQYRQSTLFNQGVINIDGNLRCSALPVAATGNVADRPWFRRAIDTQQFTVSGYLSSRLSGQQIQLFAVPLYDMSDEVSGVVFATWELTSREKSLSDLQLDPGIRLILADRSGVVLGSSPANPDLIGQMLPDKRVLDAIRAGNIGVPDASDPGSTPVLSQVDVVKVGDTVVMYAVVSTDRNAIVSRINVQFYRNLIALLGVLALVMTAAWRLGGRWISRRAAAVSAVAQRIGGGSLEARTGFRTSPDEIDQIGFAIDRMADALQSREAALRVNNRRLRDATRIARLGHWEFDVTSGRGWWSPETPQMFFIKATDGSVDAFLEWVQGDDRERVAAAYRRLQEEGATLDIEFRIAGVDGNVRWVHSVGECIRDGEGRPLQVAGTIQDITPRKRAAEEQAASALRYQQLFDANPVPIVMYDPATLQFTAANAAFSRQYGYSEAELKELRVTDLNAPETHDRLRAQIQALRLGISTSKGIRNIKKDGTVIDVEVTRIRTIVDGKPVVISSPVDVTDRLRAERELTASEERYRLLFESNPLPLWVYDPETLRFLDVNEVACARYGYSRQEFLAMTIRDIRPPEDVARLEESIPAEGVTQMGAGQWRHRRKDGTLIQVEINSHDVMLNGRRARFVCPIDVTAQVYAQEEIRRMNLLLERKVDMRTEELARSLALQQSLFDNVPQVVWLADLNGMVTFFNRAWSERIGTDAEGWKGDRWSRALHPEDVERITAAWRKAAPAQDKFECDYRLRHRDGMYRDYQVLARKVFAPSGEPLCWVGLCTDVTDSRQRENALQFANQELEAFSSSVSHDLRAPLRTVAGFSERLQAESADRLDEQGRHYLERIRAGAASMSELIDDLLSLSRVTRTDMAMGKVNLSELARQVFDELHHQQPEHPAEIIIQEHMTARGDAGLLRVVLVNLIGNALKFSGKRPVSRIEIGEQVRPGEMSVFFVRDNGAGFDPAYAAKMFGVFQRMHSTKEFPGTGIGLATVRRIIHRHGGDVRAEGAVDEGATISFSLRRE
ncbi:MAG: PAS domain S-box protein [Betaproteobacteria bacterium]